MFRTIKKGDKVRRKKILHSLINFHLRVKGFSFPQYILFIGICFEFIALLLPWHSYWDPLKTSGVFSSIFGMQWVLIIFSFFLFMYLFFSRIHKQKLRMFWGVNFTDFHMFILFSSWLFLSHINNIIVLRGMYSFTSSSQYHSGVVVSTIWGVLCLLWALLYARRFSNYSPEGYYRNFTKSEDLEKEGDGKITKLPF